MLQLLRPSFNEIYGFSLDLVSKAVVDATQIGSPRFGVVEHVTSSRIQLLDLGLILDKIHK